MVVFGATVNPDGTTRNAPDLWIWNAGAVRNLTNYGTASGAPVVTSYTLSADGSEAAYVLSGEGGQTGEIHTVEVASGMDRLLTTNKQGCVQPMGVLVCPACFFPCVRDPHFTPDGSVLYTAPGGLYVVNASGAVSALTGVTGYVTGGPRRVISDGGVLAFTGTPDAYVMNLDGSGLRNLTHLTGSGVFAQNVVIAAGGTAVAFESNYGVAQENAPQIFVVNTDGTGLRQVSAGAPATNASISGDGSLVAYQQSGQIHVAGAAGGAAALTGFRYSTAQDAVLSDDGSEVAFTIGPNGARGAIYQAAAGGGASVPIYAPVGGGANRRRRAR